MDAPASRNSRASRPVRTPPQPMIGTSGSASRTSHTERTAIGRMAGPERPPESPARAGRNVTGSIAIPGSVLPMERPSAPAATQARAIATMSVTSGESLAKTGMSYRADPRTEATTVLPAGAASPDRPPGAPRRGFERVRPPRRRRVRTPELDLERGDAGRVRQPGGDLAVLPGGVPGDRHERAGAARQQPRQVALEEAVEPRPLQADRGEQAARRLGHPRGRVARPRLEGHRLGDHRADPGHVGEMGKLAPRARAAGGGEDGRGQVQVPDPGPQVSRHGIGPP